MENKKQAVSEVKAYKVFYYECECPHCEATVRVADDDGASCASFDQECTECEKIFPTRCE
ncbi:MAG: hypothetical protein HAW67_01300 [Endozoicomonadaceae bacterium]|nr:hypothetical protein [Endozoicomonadaceae bacterium]